MSSVTVTPENTAEPVWYDCLRDSGSEFHTVESATEKAVLSQ